MLNMRVLHEGVPELHNRYRVTVFFLEVSYWAYQYSRYFKPKIA